jgi:integrase
MKGKVRTFEKCPGCGNQFHIVEEIDIYCPFCNTRPRTYFLFLYWDKEKYRLSRDTDGHILDSYKRAHRLLEHIRKEIDNGTFNIDNYLPKEIDRFRGKSLFPKWYEVKISEGRAPSHLREIERYIRVHYLPFWSDYDFRKIKAGDIEDFYMQFPKHLSPKTKKNILTEFKTFLYWLKRREVIVRIPEFPKFDIPEPMIYPIDRNTQMEILTKIPRERARNIIEFLIHHPIRPGEARALQVHDFFFHDGNWYLWIRRTFSMKILKERKNKNPYVLPLSPHFISMLKRLCKDKLPAAFIFTNQYGRPFSNESLQATWNNAKRRAGLGHLRTTLYQGTKHSWGTRAINRGLAPEFIQKAMGLSTKEMVLRYARLNVEGLRLIMEQMENAGDLGAADVQK